MLSHRAELLLLLISRSSARWRERVGVAGKHPAAVGGGHSSGPHGGRAIFGEEAFHGDFITRLQRILAPAASVQTIGREGFTFPTRYFSVGAGDVHVDPGVGIDP